MKLEDGTEEGPVVLVGAPRPMGVKNEREEECFDCGGPVFVGANPKELGVVVTKYGCADCYIKAIRVNGMKMLDRTSVTPSVIRQLQDSEQGKDRLAGMDDEAIIAFLEWTVREMVENGG